MSHNIHHADYPLNVNKKAVQAEWDDYAAHEDWQEGCTGLDKNIRWIESPIYSSYEEALKAVEKLDRGWYDQLAVKYYDRIPEKDDKKLSKIKEETILAMKEYNKRNEALYSKTLKANLITCKRCNSKLSKEYLKSNFCPVCHADLRPDHILNSIRAAKDKWTRKQEAVKDYVVKHGKKETRWLVKIEYHT